MYNCVSNFEFFDIFIAGRVLHMLGFNDLRLRSGDNLRSVCDSLHRSRYVPWRLLSFTCLVFISLYCIFLSD